LFLFRFSFRGDVGMDLIHHVESIGLSGGLLNGTPAFVHYWGGWGGGPCDGQCRPYQESPQESRHF
jgi:hypothetical protein